MASGLLATSYKGDVRFHHAPLGRLSGLVGVQTFFDDFTVSGEEQHLIPSNQARSVGVYAFEQLELNRWTLSFGGRYDYRHLDVTEDPDAARRHGHRPRRPVPTTRSSGTSARCFT